MFLLKTFWSDSLVVIMDFWELLLGEVEQIAIIQ